MIAPTKITRRKSRPCPVPVPTGVARVIMLLMQRSLTERSNVTKSGSVSKDAIWMRPDGTIVRKPGGRAKLRSRKTVSLLIHDPRYDESGVARISFVSRLVLWVVQGHFVGLLNELTLPELADAYAKGFFGHIWGDGQKVAKLAIANRVRQQLARKATHAV